MKLKLMAFEKKIQRIYLMSLLTAVVVLSAITYFLIPPRWIIGVTESIRGTEVYVQNYTCHKSGIEAPGKNELISKNNASELTTPNKWIILLTVNIGFFDIFENWWKHFRTLGIRVNITVVAEDDLVFEKLTTLYKIENVKIVRSWILNISTSLEFSTTKYNKMVSTRPIYILKYVEECFNVIYCDIDSVWLKNPFPYFEGNFDMWTQTENNGERICSGFMAVKSNKRTVTLLKRWIYVLAWRNQLNQPALNDVIRISNIKISGLDERQKFVGGPTFSDMTHERCSGVVVLHATFCYGHEGKIDCFKNWHLWKM